jgi:hypothetical protein
MVIYVAENQTQGERILSFKVKSVKDHVLDMWNFTDEVEFAEYDMTKEAVVNELRSFAAQGLSIGTDVLEYYEKWRDSYEI